MANLSVNISDDSMEKFELLSQKVFESKKGITLESLIESGYFNYNGELIKYSDIIDMPSLSLQRLKYRGAIRTPFRRNFEKLSFRYKKELFSLLYIWCNGHDKQNRLMYNDLFLGVNENISINYVHPDLEKIDPKKCANMGLYINIKGKVGSKDIKELIEQQYRRDSIVDPDSTIWISRYERFVSEKFVEDKVYTLYDEILKVLNLKPNWAIQLDYEDLDVLIKHFKHELNISKF